MLLLSNDLLSKQVLSLRTSQPVAKITSAIINPNNLKVEGFFCIDSVDKSELILVVQDIRETIADGYIINDHDVLCSVDDLVRLQDIISINFSLINKPVETISKDKIGKVQDFSTDTESFYINKLYVTPPIYRSLNGSSLIVDRTQINEISPKKITIYDLLKTSSVQVGATAT